MIFAFRSAYDVPVTAADSADEVRAKLAAYAGEKPARDFVLIDEKGDFVDGPENLRWVPRRLNDVGGVRRFQVEATPHPVLQFENSVVEACPGGRRGTIQYRNDNQGRRLEAIVHGQSEKFWLMDTAENGGSEQNRRAMIRAIEWILEAAKSDKYRMNHLY